MLVMPGRRWIAPVLVGGLVIRQCCGDRVLSTHDGARHRRQSRRDPHRPGDDTRRAWSARIRYTASAFATTIAAHHASCPSGSCGTTKQRTRTISICKCWESSASRASRPCGAADCERRSGHSTSTRRFLRRGTRGPGDWRGLVSPREPGHAPTAHSRGGDRLFAALGLTRAAGSGVACRSSTAHERRLDEDSSVVKTNAPCK
jgi:hypothetical protein